MKLNDGRVIPEVGLGVFRAEEGRSAEEAVAAALGVGYRHIDTASIYRNERSVGRAIRASGIPREEVFVTTKLWNDDHARVRVACEASLERLGLDYVDLYLIHWPVPGLRNATWRELEKLKAEGLARSIGVSNYLVPHLEELSKHAAITPAVNQIELHPFCFQHRRATVELCRQQGIVLEAYCPLTRGQRLSDPSLARIAAKYGKTPAQILIRWALQHRFVVLPKSTKPERIRANFEVFDFELADEDQTLLDGLDEKLIVAWDPATAP